VKKRVKNHVKFLVNKSGLKITSFTVYLTPKIFTQNFTHIFTPFFTPHFQVGWELIWGGVLGVPGHAS
jgi:hypothetical protein